MKTAKKQAARRSCVQKMAIAAGSVAGLGVAATGAEAAAISVIGSPVTLSLADPIGATATWDVDGANGADFRLFRNSAGTIFLGSDGMNGRGLVAPFSTDNVQALTNSFNVGPTLAAGVWGNGSYRYRNAMGAGGGSIGYDFNFGFVPGNNFVGFRFLAGANTHYGFARMNFDITNNVVSIVDWVYESTPNAFVHVEDIVVNPTAVPEPASLSLLSLGAGGLAVLRRRKQAKAAAETRN